MEQKEWRGLVVLVQAGVERRWSARRHPRYRRESCFGDGVRPQGPQN